LFTGQVFSQLVCGTTSSQEESNINFDPCTTNPPLDPDYGNVLFIPSENSEILEVNVNIWIFTHPLHYPGNTSDPSIYHFTADENDPDYGNQQAYLKLLIDKANERVYANVNENEICLGGGVTGSPQSIDAKIRLKLNKKNNGEDAIYYVDDDQYAVVEGGNNAFEEHIGMYPEFSSALNIVFIQNEALGWSGDGSQGMSPENFHLKINGAYQRYLEGNANVEGQNIAHELNHLLGLGHTENNDPQTQLGIFEFECNYDCYTYPFDDPFNHNMSCGGLNQRYLSPLQVGHIRRHLTTTFKSRILTEIPEPREVFNIHEDMIFEDDVVWNGDICVNYGAKLVVKGELVLTDDARIFVKRGGKLFVDGGKITSCSEQAQWRGILVEGGDKSLLNPQLDHPKMAVYPGVAGTVFLSNGAIIENAVTGISTNNRHLGWPELIQYWGGLIRTGSGATFVNCNRAIQIMKYGTQARKDKSQFVSTYFTKLINGITIWDSDGISIQECNFEEIDRTGLYVYDAQVVVDNGNYFEDMMIGIDVHSSKSVNSIQEIGSEEGEPNLFVGTSKNAINIYNEMNTTPINIVNNKILFGTGAFSKDAIRVAGNSYYDIRNNSIEKGLTNCFGNVGGKKITNNNIINSVKYFVDEDWLDSDCERPTFFATGNGNVEILDALSPNVIQSCGSNFTGEPLNNLFQEIPNTINELQASILSLDGLNELNADEMRYHFQLRLKLFSLYLNHEDEQQGFDYFASRSAFQDKIFALNILMEKDEITMAFDYVQSLSSTVLIEHNYLRAQTINLDYQSNMLEYQLSEQDYNFLKYEAVNSKEYIGILAAVLKFITGEEIQEEEIENFNFNAKQQREKISNQENNIIIRPNPVVEDFFYIEGIKQNEMTSLDIFSYTGKKVYSTKVIDNFVDISDLEQGTYFIKISQLEKKSVKKLIRL